MRGLDQQITKCRHQICNYKGGRTTHQYIPFFLVTQKLNNVAGYNLHAKSQPDEQLFILPSQKCTSSHTVEMMLRAQLKM